jgi:hypothetical protein
MRLFALFCLIAILTLLSSGCALFKKKKPVVLPIKIYSYKSSTKEFCRRSDDCLKESDANGFISLHPEEFKKIGLRLDACSRQGNQK